LTENKYFADANYRNSLFAAFELRHRAKPSIEGFSGKYALWCTSMWNEQLWTIQTQQTHTSKRLGVLSAPPTICIRPTNDITNPLKKQPHDLWEMVKS